jgi:primary-amine oxidase
MAPRRHPLHQITDEEITRASSIVKRGVNRLDIRDGTRTSIRFKSVSLQEAPKALLLPYLDAEANGIAYKKRPFVPRCLNVIWSYDNERKVIESVVSMDSNTEVDRNQAAPGQHGSIDR